LTNHLNIIASIIAKIFVKFYPYMIFKDLTRILYGSFPDQGQTSVDVIQTLKDNYGSRQAMYIAKMLNSEYPNP